MCPDVSLINFNFAINVGPNFDILAQCLPVLMVHGQNQENIVMRSDRFPTYSAGQRCSG